MPSSIVVPLTARQQDFILAQLRQARYGYLLSLHILLWLHHGYSPTQIATGLFCSRSSVYRSVAAWRSGTLNLTVPVPLPRSWWGRAPADDLRRKLTVLLRSVPRAFGWMRTRWSCACLALTLSRQAGYQISAETVRRRLHQADYVWKRPSLAARDDDPARATLPARISLHWEELDPREALMFADELALHLLPKVGAQWTPRGQRLEIVTPGQDQRCYVAAALDFRTGKLLPRTGAKKKPLFVSGPAPSLASCLCRGGLSARVCRGGQLQYSHRRGHSPPAGRPPTLGPALAASLLSQG